MNRKRPISWMSDEFKSDYPFCGEYQEDMRKFTLARKAYLLNTRYNSEPKDIVIAVPRTQRRVVVPT